MHAAPLLQSQWRKLAVEAANGEVIVRVRAAGGGNVTGGELSAKAPRSPRSPLATHCSSPLGRFAPGSPSVLPSPVATTLSAPCEGTLSAANQAGHTPPAEPAPTDPAATPPSEANATPEWQSASVAREPPNVVLREWPSPPWERAQHEAAATRRHRRPTT